MKTIALCGVTGEIVRALERHGGWRLLFYGDEPVCRGDVQLAEALRGGPQPDLTVIGYPGAAGLAACDHLRGQSGALPILWLCDRREFKPEARQLGVNFYTTGPPSEAALPGILNTIQAYAQGEQPRGSE